MCHITIYNITNKNNKKETCFARRDSPKAKIDDSREAMLSTSGEFIAHQLKLRALQNGVKRISRFCWQYKIMAIFLGLLLMIIYRISVQVKFKLSYNFGSLVSSQDMETNKLKMPLSYDSSICLPLTQKAQDFTVELFFLLNEIFLLAALFDFYRSISLIY